MKYVIGLLLVFLINNSIFAKANSNPQKPNSTIEITNPLDVARDELVEIPFNTFLENFSWLKGGSFKLINAVTKTELPYQLEYKGRDQPVNILVYVSIGPEGSLTLAVKEGKPTTPKSKTFARYVPERYDDFAWENDKVAFRMYGAALEDRKDNALGIDVWSKRTSELIVNKWYKSEDYHSDHGDGMDYYSVGNSLGAGDIGLYVKDSIFFTNNYKSWKVLDNGPLRSTFQLTYPTRNVLNIPVTVIKTISLDAGSQLNKIEAVFNYQGKADYPAVVGIVKRNGKGSVLLDEQEGIIGYWEPVSAENGITGIGCVMTENVREMKTENNHLLSIGSLSAKNGCTYYSGASWNRAGDILSSKDWFNYLSDFSLKTKRPVVVRFI